MKNKTYEDFVNKFKRVKSSDETYTSENIKRLLAEYVEQNFHIPMAKQREIFTLEKDYRLEKIEKDEAVVDNPPFSILSEIVAYFLEKKIRFFLHAPTLTSLNLFRKKNGFCVIFTGQEIVYENGARIAVCFVTNLISGKTVFLDPDLGKAIKAAKTQKKQKPSRLFPNDFFTGAKLNRMAAHGERGFMKSSEFHPSLFMEGKKIKIFGGAIRGNFFRGENEWN